MPDPELLHECVVVHHGHAAGLEAEQDRLHARDMVARGRIPSTAPQAAKALASVDSVVADNAILRRLLLVLFYFL